MSLMFAFVAGLVTFIDPCVIAMVPAYLGYLAAQPSRRAATVPDDARELVLVDTGRAGGDVVPVLKSAAEAEEQLARWPLIRRTLLFIAGFSTLFLFIGVLVVLLGRRMAEWVPWFWIIGAIVTILIGLALLGRLVAPLQRVSDRLKVLPFVRSPKGAYTLGLAMAVAWIPCVGPIMFVVASAAGLFEQLWQGLAFLVLFCAGLGVPFLAVAWFGEALLARLRPLRRVVTVATAVAGVLMIVLGGLVLHHGGYEALEHEVAVVYEEYAPGLFAWRDESQYEDWWEHWFTGEEEGEEGH
jgi:cytochrome c-type biogenesis protein